MRKADFQGFISEVQSDLQASRQTIKNKYDASERQAIFGMCRKFSRASFPLDHGINKRVDEEVLRPYFLRSLKVFNSSEITDYFTDRTKKIQLLRKSGIDSEGVTLSFTKGEGRQTTFKMHVPRTLTMNDQIGYAHEMGHVPEIELLRRSFLEYEEVLPMFLEFITHLRRDSKFENALSYFLFVRLPMEQSVARDLEKLCKGANTRDPLISKYHYYLIADWYKFLESLEYAIQLIYRSKDDMEAVTTEIENILCGKSLIDVAEDLDIHTEGCPMLQQEIKRIGRM